MALNETIIETIKTIDYKTWTEITQNPIFLIGIISVWLIPLLFYLLVGTLSRAKSPSGQLLSRRMIEYPNFWYSFVIWFFIQSALILILIIFPFWIEWI